MRRCNHPGCAWVSDDTLVDEHGQPVLPAEQLRLHAEDKTHPLCLLCRRSLRPGEARVCERSLTGLHRTLHDLVDLYAVLPVELGQIKAVRYDSGGGKGAREHALPGGQVLTLLAPGGDGGVARRLTPTQRQAAAAAVRRAHAQLAEHHASGDPTPHPGEAVQDFARRRAEHVERTRDLRLRVRVAEQAAEGREHAADQLEADGISLAQALSEMEDQWRRVRGEPAADRAPTVIGAAGYLERHMRWASVTLDPEEFTDFAQQLRSLLQRARAAAGLSEQPAKANTHCLDCGGDLVQQYSPPQRCDHGPRPPFPPTSDAAPTVEARRRLHELQLQHWEQAHASCDQGGRPQEWRCSRCERTYDDGQYRLAVEDELTNATPDTTGTAREIAAAVSRRTGRTLLASTIRTWKARGDVHPVGHDRKRGELYRLGDVEARARARHAARTRACTAGDAQAL